MKTKLGLLLLMLLIAVWCEDSNHGQQPVKSITNTIGMNNDARRSLFGYDPTGVRWSRIVAGSVESLLATLGKNEARGQNKLCVP
jgi:hypothetical protein